MNSLRRLFVGVAESFNPLKYKVLKQNSVKSAFVHFLFVVLIGVLLSSVLYYPALISFPNDVKSAFSGFETFRLNPDIETTEPVVILGEDYLVFDTNEVRSPNSSRYFVDGVHLYYDYGTKQRDLSRVGDLLEHKDLVFGMMNFFMVVLIPSFIVSFYILSLIVFFTLILILTIMFILFSKLFKKKANFTELVSSGFHAATFLSLGMVANALNTGLGLIILSLFVLYFLIGAISPSKKNDGNTKMKKKKEKTEEIEFDDD